MARIKKEEDQTLTGTEATYSRVSSMLKEFKGEHYNDVEEIDYKVSTGSLRFDIALNGGFGPGIHRFCGINEGGKTSCALQVASNFQKTVENSFIVYIKAEGRLDKTVLSRSGIDTSENKLLILSTNQFECAFKVISRLVEDNKENSRFCFILDSVDALTLKVDREKGFEESQKVAGGALIASFFLKQKALPLTAYGHMMILISQVRATVDIHGGGGNFTQESGGNALKHYANFVVEFRQRYEPDFIYENPKGVSRAARGARLGHYCKVLFKKSINEKTGTEISYPICYGRTGGKSIWIEYEVLKLLEMWKMYEQKGPWINLVPDALSLLKDNHIPIDDDPKWCGEAKFLQFLSDRQDIIIYFMEYFKGLISNA
jgi:RecA/RadA recombinase